MWKKILPPFLHFGISTKKGTHKFSVGRREGYSIQTQDLNTEPGHVWDCAGHPDLFVETETPETAAKWVWEERSSGNKGINTRYVTAMVCFVFLNFGLCLHAWWLGSYMCHYLIHTVGRCSFLMRRKAPICRICSYNRNGNSTPPPLPFSPPLPSVCCHTPSINRAMGNLWFSSCIALEL